MTTADSNLKYSLDTQSGYVRDTIELVPWLQVLAGLRYDRFDVAGLDMNINTLRARVDEKLSKQAAVIFKPRENLSIYAAYSTSFLPASGDQFSRDHAGHREHRAAEIREQGNRPQVEHLPAGCSTRPRSYDLKRTNVPIADPSNPGFFLTSGSHHIRGFETQLTGYVTEAWQIRRRLRLHRRPHQRSDVGRRWCLATASSSCRTISSRWWNKYQINPVWAGALGVIYFSDSFASSDDTVKLPGFVRFDSALYAKINETWKAQLNIENILNTRYWASADGNNNISPGQSRTLRLKAIATF